MTSAHAVSEGFKKISGVESVEVGLKRGHGLVKLKPGNRAQVEDFWKVVWGNGNKPKQTEVVAVGEVIEKGGVRVFRVPETGREYVVETGSTVLGRVKIVGVLEPPKDKKSAVAIRIVEAR